MESHERFTWAAYMLEVQPTDHILEIGCGAGLLVEKIATLLTSGTVTAIDQSVPMITLAAKRNQLFMATGKVSLVVGNFSKATFPESAFDKIVAFNVNFFWKDPANELSRIKKCLKAEGRLCIFYQTPNSTGLLISERIKHVLLMNSFQIVDRIIYHPIYSASAFCIIACPG